MVGKPNHVLRARFPGILCERLVAGEINARLRVLGKAHGRHVGEQRGYGAHELGQSRGGLHFLQEPAVFFSRFFSFRQRLLQSPIPMDFIIYIDEPHGHACPAAWHVHLAKVNAIISRPGFQRAEKGDGKSPLGFELFQNIGQADLFLHSLLVFRGNHGGDVFGFCIGVLRVAQRVVDGFIVNGIHVRVEKRAFFGYDVVDQPDRVVVIGQRFDDGVAGCRAHFLLFMFFCNVRNKDNIDSAVGFRFRIVAVVVHPPDRAVLPNDAVFRIVQFVIAGSCLLNDG